MEYEAAGGVFGGGCVRVDHDKSVLAIVSGDGLVEGGIE